MCKRCKSEKDCPAEKRAAFTQGRMYERSFNIQKQARNKTAKVLIEILAKFPKDASKELQNIFLEEVANLDKYFSLPPTI